MRRIIWLPAFCAVALSIAWLRTPAERQRDEPSPAGAPMQGDARSAGNDSRFGISAPAERPAAMSDPVTYAATRLREIKADPANWDDVWTWRREFAAADTPELRREVTGLARQVGPDPLLAVLAQA